MAYPGARNLSLAMDNGTAAENFMRADARAGFTDRAWTDLPHDSS
jgi:hypothetical protein